METPQAYYNEIDKKACAALRQLIAEGTIAPGVVDERSIEEVNPDDLRPFTQWHFFAGGGLWSVAARAAGWSDARPIGTASCPCQPYSGAGKQLGVDDPRHLWPDLYRIIRAARAGGFGPPVWMGEQVAKAAGYGWFDGVRADLARENIASRTVMAGTSYWPTPLSNPNKGGHDRETGTGAPPIGELMTAAWSTPRASDGEKGGPNQSFSAGGTPLPTQMHRATWITPSARDGKDTPGMATVRPDGGSRIDMLPRQMMHLAPATDPTSPTPNGLPATTAKRGAPNPVFPCGLMGWPDEVIFGALRGIQYVRSSRQKSSPRSSTPSVKPPPPPY